ncbi:MAG: alanine--tRNA ligase [Candidatus Nealsonbacteria bacterium]|nr:alanine--tRNA ligase [Candidatus Nealsonbacteria bacterium]
MDSFELRQKFLDFFQKRGHQIVPSSSLLPGDPSVLFTTAVMQQFKPYYLGEKSPYGLNAATCQKCFRTSDIDEVGDERHLTFFEMLGNFSFGGYWKKEAIQSAFDFLVGDLGLKIDYVSVFAGEEGVPADVESEKIWKEIDPGLAVKKFGRKDNFWGPTGQEGPCGPTTEIYIRGLEVWNIVFNQYYQQKNGMLEPLKLQGIDTGMGLERLAMVSQNVSTVFETDLFSSLLKGIPGEDLRVKRIIADHVKAAVFLIQEGVLPSNVERGYVLRRILRRAIRYGKILNLPKSFLAPLARKAIEIYQNVYPELKSGEKEILSVMQDEEGKFEKTLEQGLREFERGRDAFTLYSTYGFPIELTLELAQEQGKKIDVEEFKKEFEKHQDVSRAGAEKKFGGHGLAGEELAEGKEKLVRLHTATHLLHAALRQVLGDHVQQMGSDINLERTRFDFKHPAKMTPEEIKKVEDLVNGKIKEDLAVRKEEMVFSEALKAGALAFFREKYPERVSIYSVNGFSKEICAGPHVKNTSEIGGVKIVKEESSSAGVRRIRAVLVEP